MEYLKSDVSGTSLITHSKAVQKIALLMSDRLKLKDEIREYISMASLLHDIGKCYSEFQNYIEKSIMSKEFNDSKLLHHEISWAILNQIISNDKYEPILYSVYWHHSREMSNNKEYASSIIEMLSESNKTRIINFYNILTGNNKTINDIDINNDMRNDKIPEYYVNKNGNRDSINVIVLSCVISADRLSSGADQERILIDDNYCNQLINKLTYSTNKVFTIPESLKGIRTDYQLQCVDDIGDSQTTLLKAPAGFGKTIVGIMSWIRNGSNKLIWVCPRNVIAEATYESVIKELEVLNIHTTVELYLTGKQKNKNYDYEKDDFSSDIIITNIDNFLTPTINNSVRNRMYSIMSNYVIFDEFHELIADEPYFACFINIMKARNRYTNSKTLLMSATPIKINLLWDTLNKSTRILPDSNSHYNAPHSSKYKVELFKGITNVLPNKNSLLITNSIRSCQILTIDKNYSIIAHSKFTDVDRDAIIKNIFERYSKGKDIDNKIDTISAPIIQAAMDLSFGEMIEIPKSPEDTFQRLGRLNRWGEYVSTKLHICTDIKNERISKSEVAAIRTTYNIELSNKWVQYLKDNVKTDKEYTLDELYLLYNDFSIINEESIKIYIKTKYENSIRNLSKLFPRKIINIKDGLDKNELSRTSNVSKLRDNGSDKIYCIYPIYESNEFTDVFSVDKNTELNERENNTTQLKQIKAIKKLLKDPRFEYNAYATYKNNSRFTSIKAINMAKNPKTPYICFDKVYHPKLGLIDTTLLP